MEKQSTNKGFAILSAAGIIVKVLSLLYLPFLIDIIGGSGYGYYSKAYQIYVFIYVITNTGIPIAISKLISELTAVKNYKDAVRSFKLARLLIFGLGLVMTIIMLLIAYPVTVNMHARKVYIGVLTLAPAILFTSISAAYRGYFQGRGNMTPTAIAQIIEQVVNTIFTLVFAALFMKYGLAAALAGGTLGTTLAAIISAGYIVIYYKRHNKFKVLKADKYIEVERYSNKQLLRKIINYGVPITLCVSMTYLGNLVDAVNTSIRLIASGKYNDISSNALYGNLSKYQQLINVPIAIITALSVAILPAIASVAILNNKEAVKNKIDYSLRLCFLIAVPSAVGLAVLSDPVFKLIFPHNQQGAHLMKIGAVVIVLMAVVQIQTSILQGIGKLYTATIYAAIGIVAKITANYFLIVRPSINISGAVYGSIIGFSIPLILNHIMIRKTLKVKISLLSHAIKPVASAAIMGLIVYFAYTYLYMGLSDLTSHYLISNAVSTFMAVIIGMYIYTFGLILIGGIKKQDLNSIPNKVTRLLPKRMLARIR